MDEYRLLNGKKSRDRKKGSERYDRMPLSLFDEFYFERKEDFVQIIPYNLNESFTVKEFAAAASIHRDLAQVTLHVLYHMQILERIDKRGREYLYTVLE
jgi:hypothetical protein